MAIENGWYQPRMASTGPRVLGATYQGSVTVAGGPPRQTITITPPEPLPANAVLASCWEGIPVNAPCTDCVRIDTNGDIVGTLESSGGALTDGPLQLTVKVL